MKPIVKVEKDAGKWRDNAIRFKSVIHVALNVNEREQWAKSPGMSGLQLSGCGCYTHATGHRWERQGVDEGVYLYCVDGKGHYQRGKQTLTISPGEVLYCFPKSHHAYWADEDEPWTIYWMHIFGKRARFYENKLGLTHDNHVLRIGIHSDIINLFKQLFNVIQTVNNDADRLAIQSCAANIIGMMAVKAHASSALQQKSSEVEMAIRRMSESLDKSLTVEDLAGYIGLSPFYFSRLFRKTTGTSPMHYFHQLKVQKACSLIASSNLKVKQVAGELGFDDQYYFSRLFKKIMGCSPEHYRISGRI
jgi:AraC family transcriptional regulator, arabinose operon regulatory protein